MKTLKTCIALTLTSLCLSAFAAPWTLGEVKKIDSANARVTLAHGEIKNLNMPAMTMAFRVAQPAMLTQVKVGDKLRFQASMEGGVMTVTKWEKAQP